MSASKVATYDGAQLPGQATQAGAQPIDSQAILQSWCMIALDKESKSSAILGDVRCSEIAVYADMRTWGKCNSKTLGVGCESKPDHCKGLPRHSLHDASSHEQALHTECTQT